MPIDLTQLGLVEQLARKGLIFVSSDADENDRVTGQTSLVTTTPSFLLDVPPGVTAIPLFVNLTQCGTVAGGDVSIRICVDRLSRYSSGGTQEKAYGVRYAQQPTSRLFSNPTATTGYGIKVFAAVTGADVSPAEGAIQGPYWQAEVPYFLDGPASFLIYTDAAVTGPTWEWAICWAESPTGDTM